MCPSLGEIPAKLRQNSLKLLSSTSYRLQNSPYFCVFKYARAIKQKVWNKTENRERGSRASRAKDSYATCYRFLYWFWEKKSTVLQSMQVIFWILAVISSDETLRNGSECHPSPKSPIASAESKNQSVSKRIK